MVRINACGICMRMSRTKDNRRVGEHNEREDDATLRDTVRATTAESIREIGKIALELGEIERKMIKLE